MTARPLPPDFRQLTEHFRSVRRAWKRGTALAGLAVVTTEGIGILTLLLFIDWLYQPLPIVRVGLSLVSAAVIGVLFWRQVIKPLLRKIPDEQVALYMEEHRAELDGILITAVEYGRKRADLSGSQAVLIDAVMKEAAARGAGTRLARLVDFSRLRKYGLGAAVGVGLYLLLGALFPAAFGYHIARVLQPWHATEQDLARHEAAVQMAAPLRFTLSRGNTSLARGTSFDFEATLSKARPANVPLMLSFRPRGSSSDWQHLPMTELEKLNGFQGNIPDVSEDLDFYVACGSDKSDTYQLRVFDPLVVQSMAMTTHYPAYTKLPDEIQKPFGGDLAALAGSTATLRFGVSTALKAGTLKWSDGRTQAIDIDPKSASSASVSFEVKQDATYDYLLTDVNGQTAASPAPLSVHAIADTPPTIRVLAPQSPVLTQPLGEIDFQAEAGDDFGVVGVDLVYALLDARGEAHETRVPLQLGVSDSKDLAHGVSGGYHLMLEDHSPPFRPDDAISYHMEARDGKGQVTSSEIGFILVGYYEHWATWATPEESGVHDETAPDLMALLSLTWQLDSKKNDLAADDFRTQSQAIAAKLEGPDGNVFDFLNLEHFPELARVANIVNAHVRKAHDALQNAQTPPALSDLSAAVALTAGAKLKENSVTHLTDPQAMVGSHFTPPAFTLLEQARLNALAANSRDKTHEEDTQGDAEKAAAMAAKVDELRRKQDALIAAAEKQSASGSDSAPSPGSKPAPPSDASAGKSTESNAKLAADQHELAEKTRATGEQARGGAAPGGSKLEGAANKTGEAARLMEEAARNFAAGKNAEGRAKAELSRAALQAAGAALHNTDRDQLEAAISDAARHAAVLLEKQHDLTGDTGTLAQALGAGKPDQRQARDLQAQAYRETVLGAGADTLGKEITDLNQLAVQADQPDATRALTEAQRIIKRTPPQAKMSDAVIDLNGLNPSSAQNEQKDAEAALSRIVATLQSSSDALAANREAQLNRAARAAESAKASVAALQGKQPAAAAGAPNAPGTSASSPGGGTVPPAGSASSSGPGGGTGDEARQAAYNLTELAAVIDNRQLVPQDDVDRLKQMGMDRSALEKRLAADPKFLQDISGLVGAISEKIAAEKEAKAQAGKLFSSQREECPPNYRQFVNKYFEALSHIAPAPAAGAQP